MLNKAAVSILNTKHLFTSKIKSRDGMEMLQLVILIAISIALGGIVFYFLQTYFQGDFWTNFQTKMNNIFNTTATGNPNN